MKSPLLLVAVLALIAASLAFTIKELNTSQYQSTSIQANNKKDIIRCGPDWESLKTWLDESDIPPIPGAGSYKWKISTNNDSAQFYFNQGINMYYSFHIIEAMASFKKALKFDPNCAMLYWAEALTYGPNINDLGYAASPDALLAIDIAKGFISTASNIEKKLIEAQLSRYSSDTTATREELNQMYANKMQELYLLYPDAADLAALYADALMLQHPWDLWKTDGTPKPWTPLIREVLEKLLEQTPNHPGANHYYIHVMEASPFFDQALPSADRLGKLTPGLSHTVHMPSHIYLRTGDYTKGASVNESAVNSYKKLIPLYAPVTGNDFLYLIHNLHMQTNNAMLAGRAAFSNTSAKETANSISKEYLKIPDALGNYVQYLYMTPVFVDVRFGNWNKLLEQVQPESSMIYANILFHFGRGMALANKNDLLNAKKELVQLQELMKNSVLLIPLSPFSASIEGSIIAENLLIGTIALKENKFSEAITAFEAAVLTEEKMVYNEPRDWLLNPKHYLGDALIKTGRLKEAKDILLKDLENNMENGWALFGLWQILIKEKKITEANNMVARFRKSFDKSDIKLYGPVF